METAKALLKGKAIREHMEDSYCEMVAVRAPATHVSCLCLCGVHGKESESAPCHLA
jgi:hypothetical protein